MSAFADQQTTARNADVAHDALRAAVERTGDAMAASVAAGANVVRLPARPQQGSSKRAKPRAK